MAGQLNKNRYEAVTHDIRVGVAPHYLDDQSSPESGQFVWAYEVEIINEREDTVQLRDRYWNITDAQGRIEEVRGPGVVGEQPILNPGDRFQYTSGCPLSTSSGFMVGSYTMVGENGDSFEVDIPAFALDLPDAGRNLN